MRMVRIEGQVTVLKCCACQSEGLGGSCSFTSPSSGETLLPDEWYVTEDGFGPYCATCAAKIAQDEDPTRSVTQFFDNTTGTQIAVEHLEES